MGQQSEFEKAAQAGRTSLIADLLGFLKENKKWWLLPVVLVVLLLAGLAVLGSSAVGPFIYTLF